MYEYHLEILKGKDKGSVYKISGGDVSIGSDPSNDLIVFDKNIEDFHVKLLYNGRSYILRDLGSKNGSFVNDKKVLEQQLFSEDVVSLAKAYKFKFIEIKSKDDVLAPPSFNPDINIPTKKKNPKKMRMIILGVFAIILLVMFMIPDASNNKKTNKNKNKSEELKKDSMTDFEKFISEKIDYNKKVPKGMESLFKRADEMYKNGRREFNIKNYTRALDFFKRALSYYPSHGQARYYAKLSLDLMHKQAKKYLILAKKLMYQFKYQEAVKNFNMVLDLLEGRENLKTYKEATKMKKIAEKKVEEFK